jgi:hypothetical protein
MHFPFQTHELTLSFSIPILTPFTVTYVSSTIKPTTSFTYIHPVSLSPTEVDMHYLAGFSSQIFWVRTTASGLPVFMSNYHARRVFTREPWFSPTLLTHATFYFCCRLRTPHRTLPQPEIDEDTADFALIFPFASGAIAICFVYVIVASTTTSSLCH